MERLFDQHLDSFPFTISHSPFFSDVHGKGSPAQYRRAGLASLSTYRSRGGYGSWQKVVQSMKPEQLIDEVKASGLRGRGGAGFPPA